MVALFLLGIAAYRRVPELERQLEQLGQITDYCNSPPEQCAE